MTQQYLVGELSLLLAELQAVATSEDSAREYRRLRHVAEQSPPTALTPVTRRALEVTDTGCWRAVTRGDMGAFRRQAAASARLHEFGVCSGLLDER